ncbi:phosphopantothenate--cysteine ligase [Enterococcus timonensis]|uniref:phosphopantothenate--cysteine ligase n=1 Tax=Enterococcus timonensis TaxID=1852364 RepID=UPI0008D96D34|nr:phosphopantothenate--cysteine ligase [Enterococcus timonensis]
MKILITAGGTSEKIDQVRSITNHSTGSLGKRIAEEMQAYGHEIYYVTTKVAAQPVGVKQIFYIESTKDLQNILEKLLTTQTFDAVIHAMAVSDFTPVAQYSKEKFQQTLAKGADIFAAKENTETKISSNTDHLVLILEKTPKIIQKIKKWQPETLLVGFKLLVDVPKEELLAVAKKSLVKNQADFVLANDLAEISGEQHHGYLLDKTGVVAQAWTKKEIAVIIETALKNFLKEKKEHK